MKEAKKFLRKCRASGSDAFLALLDHRNTPPASVQVGPPQRLFNRRTRSLLPMTANLLAPQPVSDNELCRTKLEQRKQRQAQYYNRGALDLDPLRRGDVVRLKPFTYGRQMSGHRHHQTRPLLRCLFPFFRSPMICRPPFPEK